MQPTVQKGTFNESLGACVQYQIHKQGINIEAANAHVRIRAIDHQTFQIRIAKKGQHFSDFSYALAGELAGVDCAVSELSEHLVLNLPGAKLEVQLAPVRLRFFNAQGELLNEDDAAFGTSWLGTEVTTYKKLQDGERFIGLGEKTGPLDRRGQAYVNWNTDYFGYPVDADPIYLSTPFYMGILPGRQYGLFFDNSHKTTFAFGCSNNRFSYFQAEDGEMNYYLMAGENVASILQSYSAITGRMPLPALWSLGFQQCRYSYYPTFEVLTAARTFREKDIPCDVLYLDIHYMDAYKVFTWHPERFPQPAKMLESLKKDGFNVVVILDPGIKTEAGYHAYDDGKANGLFVRYPDGEEYQGQVWPGWSAFPDFTKHETREWWGRHMHTITDVGVEGFWNDMNEPAAWGQHIPDLIEFDYDGEGGTHKKSRNVYGMQMARSTYEGARKLMGNKRPFVLTRAGYSGVQRYAAVWTGDNISADDHMLAGVRLVNAMGLTGVANAGYDVGGFAGEASPDLFARWMAIGAFSPFFRSHSMVNSKDSEPWSFGEEVEDISRNFIKLRYRLMPYLYSVFYESTQNGMPVSRSLAIDYTHDALVYDSRYHNQYLFGPSILVCPVESYKQFEKVYLPKGLWYDLFTDRTHHGEQQIVWELSKELLPLFVKAGSLIPMQSAVSSLQKDKPAELLELHYYAGAEGSFELYEDDGKSFDYQQGIYNLRKLSTNGKNQICIGKVQGKYASHFKQLKIYFHGHKPAKVLLSSSGHLPLSVKTENYRWVQPVSDFDPYHKPPGAPLELTQLPYVVLDITAEAMVIDYEA